MTQPTPLPAALKRPSAPFDLDPMGEFRPAPELGAWAREAFIEENGPLTNPDHAHLRHAHLGWLWTNVENARQMVGIAATCELGKPQAMGKWPKARAEQQVRGWFGDIPDFIITVRTDVWSAYDDVSACSLIEHELMHAGQEKDEFGAPKFSKQTGKPIFAIRGHDVQEFVGVVARYGAVGFNVADLVQAANKGPSVAPALITRACGTCNRKAA
jgi:hypothetical protein